ncbi:MAG: hypothetical protein ACP5O7_10930, partial [Phycisphaerae bacterium]
NTLILQGARPARKAQDHNTYEISGLISSISFSAPSGGDIGIFAISGVVNSTPVAAPEPAPLAALLCTLTGMILLGRRKTHG